LYLKKNKDKKGNTLKPLFETKQYRKYMDNQLRNISPEEVDIYLQEREKESEEWRNFI